MSEAPTEEEAILQAAAGEDETAGEADADEVDPYLDCAYAFSALTIGCITGARKVKGEMARDGRGGQDSP